MNRVLALAVLLAAPAVAQDRPPVRPTRDVDVTYRSTTGGQVIEQRSRFAADAQKMRLDTPTPGVYMLMDYRAKTLSMVSDGDRSALDMRSPDMPTPGVDESGVYTRRGEDQVAGYACTEWETRDRSGQPALACFTADGVMLRARRGTQILAVAIRVAYGQIDPAVFTIPPAYSHVASRRAPPEPPRP